MAQKATANGGRIEPEYHGQDRRTTTVEMDDDLLVVTHDFDRPGSLTVELPTTEKAINQYTIVDQRGVSRSGSASSKSHQDRVHILVRDGEEWHYYDPAPRMARPRRGQSDYVPTQVPGVEIKTEFRRQGGRGSESGHHKRVKVTRELVDSFDEVWLIEYRHEKGGSRNGEYKRVKNEQATRLVAGD